MPLLTLNFSCENVKYPARKHFAKTNMNKNAQKNKFAYRTYKSLCAVAKTFPQ